MTELNKTMKTYTAYIPDIDVSTSCIVGCPDFEKASESSTLRLMEEGVGKLDRRVTLGL